MTTKRFQVDLPEEVLSRFGWRESEVPDKVREALVIDLLRKHEISQGKAAELLRLSRWDLLEVMRRHEVPAIDLTPDELEQELAGEGTQDKGT